MKINSTFFSENISMSINFIYYYRMSIESFDELFDRIRYKITKDNTMFRTQMTAGERLTITLREVL